jgi:hypothetical protein
MTNRKPKRTLGKAGALPGQAQSRDASEILETFSETEQANRRSSVGAHARQSRTREGRQ